MFRGRRVAGARRRAGRGHSVARLRYTTVTEFAAHLSSYDHHHRKRFAEMKEAEKARAGGDEAVAERREREEKRRNKELSKRIAAAAAAAPPPPARPAAPPPPSFGGGFRPRARTTAPVKFGLGAKKPAAGGIKFNLGGPKKGPP